MPTPAQPFDTTKFIHVAQVGGIESYEIADGAGRGVRALCVNTGGGLRYRVLVDRGLDIDHAFHNQHSLVLLPHKGATRPSRAYDKGLDWLKSFPIGLLTSCGPTNVGPPATDEGEDLGLHGPHSNTPAELESVIQPDPRAGKLGMSITGVVRYGGLYGPNVELRRTISSQLGANWIDVSDEFFNAGNTDVPHAWLLHINFGYPLVDEGSELCYDASKVEPLPGAEERFGDAAKAKRIPAPLETHRGPTSAVAYLFPKPTDAAGNATVGLVNAKLGLAVAIHYNTKQFSRCGNWQHFGPHEYVTALEPMNGTVEGRDKDRASGTLDFIKAGERKGYRYRIEVITDKPGLDALRKLNG
ncbi:MAG: aldose 1-epimerase family protein [Planctomycetota bacterium]|nr:aldose 1-epimerase family protein [Planctomycetota bacterium]